MGGRFFTTALIKMKRSDEIQSDLEEMERDLALTPGAAAEYFTWKGAQVPCCCRAESRGLDIDLDGNGGTVAFTLIVRANQFLTADTTLTTVDSDLFTADNNKPVPVAGRKLTMRGREYRILTAKISASQAFYTLQLVDPGSNS